MSSNRQGRRDRDQQSRANHPPQQPYGNTAQQRSFGGGNLYDGAQSIPDHYDPHLQHSESSWQGQHAPMDQMRQHAQESLMRSTQASTQMMFDVFDYTIGMLEELEKHEKSGKTNPKNSGILPHLIPHDHKKPELDVRFKPFCPYFW